MVLNQVRNAYRQTSTLASEETPIKLVHLMYERTLAHLTEAKAGLIEKDPKKRGENLSKAIAIITELYASVKQDDESEAAEFLRGLYEAILLQLPKVTLGNDLTILERSYNYIDRLKQIWEQTAMREEAAENRNGVKPGGNGADKVEPAEKQNGSQPVVRSKDDKPGTVRVSVSI